MADGTIIAILGAICVAQSLFMLFLTWYYQRMLSSAHSHFNQAMEIIERYKRIIS